MKKTREGQPVFALLLLLAVGLAGSSDNRNTPNTTPLPDIPSLRERATEDYKRSAEQRERYSCEEHFQGQRLTSTGELKKTETEDRQVFFVNGHELHRLFGKGR